VSATDSRSSGALSRDGVDIVGAMDRYARLLGGTKLPIAASSDPSIVRLAWITAGLSVAVERAAVGGDYVCRLQPLEMALRARLEARTVLDELVNGDLLEPIACKDEYCLRPGNGPKRAMFRGERP